MMLLRMPNTSPAAYDILPGMNAGTESTWMQVGERYAREVTGGSEGMAVEKVEIEDRVRRLDGPDE